MHQQKIKGFAMIEVIISMALLAVILLFLLADQIAQLKDAEANNFQVIAEMQLNNFEDMLMANKTNSVRKKLFSHWNDNNQQLLPMAKGSWSEIKNHQCKIKLKYFFRKKIMDSMEVFC